MISPEPQDGITNVAIVNGKPIKHPTFRISRYDGSVYTKTKHTKTERFPVLDDELDKAYSVLKSMRTMFSIHDERNLSADKALIICSKSIWFKLWILCALSFAIADPVTKEFCSTITNIIVFWISSGLFFIGVAWIVHNMDHKEKLAIRISEVITTPEVLFEFCCFLLGWIFIELNNAISYARYFRLLRFFWYAELYRPEDIEETGGILHAILYLSHRIVLYLDGIGKELFTTDSKGGSFVLLLYLFITWVTSAIMQGLYTQGDITFVGCNTISHCFLNTLRLSVYDGTGLDLLASVMDEYPGASVILFVYMFVSAMVLLNGLIGIFSSHFTDNQVIVTPTPPTTKA